MNCTAKIVKNVRCYVSSPVPRLLQNCVVKKRIPKGTIPGIDFFFKERKKERFPIFFKGKET